MIKDVLTGKDSVVLVAGDGRYDVRDSRTPAGVIDPENIPLEQTDRVVSLRVVADTTQAEDAIQKLKESCF